MPIDSVADLVKTLRRYPLLEAAQREELDGVLQARFTCPRTLSKELLLRGWLTPYQINLVLQGRGAELMLGSYVLLERLSESLLGPLYKARHQHMKRLIALQVVRADLLAHADAVERFYAEIQKISQLAHLHLLTAYDAGPIGPTHFFALEYVEGVDLDRWVRQVGPLEVDQCCSYIHQAALGLQHAFERGLLHQDLEPANLVLAQTKAGSSKSRNGEFESDAGALDPGVIKIRNLGLTLIRAQGQPAAAEGGPTMADFLAPERADASQPGDVRGEIYSLGCIFYYLLTGRVPYPGGTPEEKQQRHRQEEPATIESVRLEVPFEVSALVRKMMDRSPAARPQTPQAVADALASWSDPTTWSRPNETIAEGNGVAAAKKNPEWKQRKHEKASKQWRRLVVGGGAALTVGVLLFVGLLHWSKPLPRSEPAAPVAATSGPTATVEAAQPWQDTHIDIPVGVPVIISARGTWKSAEAATECGGEGETALAGDRGILPDAKLMGLLMRIGDASPPQVVPLQKVMELKTGAGRLFVQPNLRDLKGANGTLTLEVVGGRVNPVDAPVWQFGCGELDEGGKRVNNFRALLFLANGNRYQAGLKHPDKPTLHLVLSPTGGGHAGPNRQFCPIRRWTAPGDGVVSITGDLVHARNDGDGICGWLVSSRHGILAKWDDVKNRRQDTNLPRVEVKRGDTLDAVVDPRGNDAHDSFEWSLILRVLEGPTLVPARPTAPGPR